MLNIKSLLLENFRIFSETSSIKLAPITILTGPNNSGKSSITGSLNFMKHLDAGKLPYRIKFDSNYDSIINNKAGNDEISIGYDLYNIILGEDVRVIFTIEKDKNSDAAAVKEVSLKNKTGILFDFRFENERIYSRIGLSHLFRKFSEIKKSRKRYAGLECKFRHIRSNSGYYKENLSEDGIRIFHVDNDLKKKKIIKCLRDNQISAFEYERLSYFFGSGMSLPGHERPEELYVKRIRSILSDFKEDEILFTNKFLNRILEIPSGELNEPHLKAVIETEFPDLFANIAAGNSDSFNQIIDLLQLKGYMKIEEEFLGKEITTSRLLTGADVQVEFSGAIENHFQTIFDEASFFKALTNLSLTGNGILREYKEFHNIKSLASFCEVVLDKILHDLQHDLDKSLHFQADGQASTISAVLEDPDKDAFVKNWFRNFNIYEDFSTETEKQESVSLSGHGKGLNHLLMMLLEIANARQYHDLRDYNGDSRNYPRTLVFEEPEANLYPAWQSQLADMFADAKKQLGLHFLIETHSAYLIKKLRYLVAKGKIDKSDIIIYYIDNWDKKTGCNGIPRLKEILINDDGTFTGEFGRGFFDESDSNLFNLRKFSKN